MSLSQSLSVSGIVYSALFANERRSYDVIVFRKRYFHWIVCISCVHVSICFVDCVYTLSDTSDEWKQRGEFIRSHFLIEQRTSHKHHESRHYYYCSWCVLSLVVTNDEIPKKIKLFRERFLCFCLIHSIGIDNSNQFRFSVNIHIGRWTRVAIICTQPIRTNKLGEIGRSFASGDCYLRHKCVK